MIKLNETIKVIEQLINDLEFSNNIRLSDIPNIDLYMDQVTTFMNDHLSNSKRYPDDKILTKTMINNYSKNKLIPPSIKKKYSKEHMVLLILIYYYKNALSIQDIEKLLKPITSKFYNKNNSNTTLERIYDQLMELQKEQINKTTKDIHDTILSTIKSFNSIVDNNDKEQLFIYSFISLLCFDIHAKKCLIEKLIDELL